MSEDIAFTLGKAQTGSKLPDNSRPLMIRDNGVKFLSVGRACHLAEPEGELWDGMCPGTLLSVGSPQWDSAMPQGQEGKYKGGQVACDHLFV